MRKSLFAAALLVWAAGCNDGRSSVLNGIPSIAYISRQLGDTGNVFDYGGGTHAHLMTLTPPTASGKRVDLTGPYFDDIPFFDVSFDARELLISGRAKGDSNFHIYRLNVDGTNPCDAAMGRVSMGPCQVTDGPYDEEYAVYMPGRRMFYVTTQNVEGAAVPQFRDEYERATTAQVATANLDGSGAELGSRNVSHRVNPTLLSDGRVMLTEWRHLCDVNEGDLTIMNQDMTGTREAFGREGRGLTNSYLHAREVSPGRFVAIGTSRDRTYQSGKLLLIDIGGPDVSMQSEARSSVLDLTPSVPGGREASYESVGRYFDAYPVGDPASHQFLVSWGPGAMETSVFGKANRKPDLGIYLFANNARIPIVNEIGPSEHSPRPLVPRREPPMQPSPSFQASGTQSTLMSAINVYDTTMFTDLERGSITTVRVHEGFSAEEGFGNDFGMTECDGQARLGEIPLQPDGSFKALIPANVPVRISLVDKFGLVHPSRGPGADNTRETVWIMGRAGEARVCGGCHEDRVTTPELAPGSSPLQALGAAALDYPGVPRSQRKSTDYSRNKIMGVPWDLAIQPILDRCVSCHNGVAGPANPTCTLVDVTTMARQDFTFDLRGGLETITVGDRMYAYSRSYNRLVGLSMAVDRANEQGLQVMTIGNCNGYVEPENASASMLFTRYLNPMVQYPSPDPNVRLYPSRLAHPAEITGDPSTQLNAEEYFRLQLAIDQGAMYYSRENAPGGSVY